MSDQVKSVGVGDKVSGLVGMMVGKTTGDQAKIDESRDKRLGHTLSSPHNTPDTHTAHSTETRDPSHPGFIYTSKGSMKQRNFGGPPPPSSPSPPSSPPALPARGSTIPPPTSEIEEAEFAREARARMGDHPGVGYTNHEAVGTRQGDVHAEGYEEPSTSTSDSKIDTDIDTDTSSANHPGIGYTKSGAMKQICIRPPPPPASEPSSSEGEQKEGGEWSETTNTTYNHSNNFDIHPHVNYAGPDLTRVIPPPDEEEERADKDTIQDEHDLTHDHDHGHGGGHDFLHGGFPTGAPSPGLRGRSKEVIDRFDRH